MILEADRAAFIKKAAALRLALPCFGRVAFPRLPVVSQH